MLYYLDIALVVLFLITIIMFLVLIYKVVSIKMFSREDPSPIKTRWILQFVIPLIAIAVLSLYFSSAVRSEISASLHRIAQGEYTIMINGEASKNKESLLKELLAIKMQDGGRTQHEVTMLEIRGPKEVVPLKLKKLSKGRYAVFYEGYSFSSDNQIGLLETSFNLEKDKSVKDSEKSKITSGKIGNYEIKNGVAYDTIEKIMWQRGHSEKVDFSSAQTYCEELNLEGFSDWRMPSIYELRSMVKDCPHEEPGHPRWELGSRFTKTCFSSDCADFYRECPKQKGSGENGFYWETNVWIGSGDGIFWSSSSRDTDEETILITDFSNGVLSSERITDASTPKHHVKCVRGGEVPPRVSVKATPVVVFPSGSFIVMGFPYLTRSVVSDTLQRQRSKILNCYQKELQTDPRLQGMMVFHLRVTNDGRIYQEKIAKSTINNEKLEKCVEGIILSVKFPSDRKAGISNATLECGMKPCTGIGYPIRFSYYEPCSCATDSESSF